MVKIHYRTCNLCEATCGLKIVHEGDKVFSVKGNPDDILSTGHICPKGVAIQDIHADPDRLRQPLKKSGDTWEQISWDEALDTVAERLVNIQKEHGFDAVATYWGYPTVHNFGSLLSVGKLRRFLKSKNNYSASSVDQLPHELVQHQMYGNMFLYTIPDIDRTDYMLMLGANPAVSNGSIWTAGDVKKRMKELVKRGGKLTLIDPRRSETAAYATQHHFIKPGTDAVFLISLLRVIFEKGLCNPGRLNDFLRGWDEIEPLLDAFSLEEAASITGISADDIVKIATEYASAERAICYGRMGVSTQAYGALCQWLIQLLNIATGNLDSPGGTMFSSPAFDLPAITKGGSHGRYKSRVRGLPETAGTLPSATLAEEMLTPGKGQIKAFVCSAGNPVLSTPNGRQLEKALDGLDFMVAVDFYINETTSKADIILPPTGPLERTHYEAIFSLLGVRNLVKYAGPMVKPPANSMDDWSIYEGIMDRIASLRATKLPLKARLWATAKKIFPYLGSADFMLDVAIRTGRYGKGFLPFKKGLSLARIKRQPNGIDLGPLKPVLPKRLFTKDKRINAAPEIFKNDIERLKNEFLTPSSEKEFPLLLIGRRDKRTGNSWMHNSERLIKGKNRCTVLLHPDDGARYQIKEETKISISSRIGTIEAVAEFSEKIMPGVVSIPHGWGHDRPGSKLRVAATSPGVSVNDITDHELIDTVSGNAAVNAVPVRLQATTQEAP